MICSYLAQKNKMMIKNVAARKQKEILSQKNLQTINQSSANLTDAMSSLSESLKMLLQTDNCKVALQKKFV